MNGIKSIKYSSVEFDDKMAATIAHSESEIDDAIHSVLLDRFDALRANVLTKLILEN